MADDQGTFRCYYDDGTILTQPVCPLEYNGSPLINSEFTIIDNVASQAAFPWWLVILIMVALVSKDKRSK